MSLASLLDRLAVDRPRVLVVGNEDLAWEANRRGCLTGYVPDDAFIRRYDEADPTVYDGLSDTRAGLSVSWDRKGFRARMREMASQGILDGGRGRTSFWVALGAVTSRASQGDREKWDAILVDTDDPWLHPSWWAWAKEGEGERSDGFLADMIQEGGLFAFREIPGWDVDAADLPEVHGDDWDRFFRDFFAEAARAEAHGAAIRSARRNGVDPWA